MKIPHDWLYPPSVQEAIQIQKQLATKVVLEDRIETLEKVAGVDVSNTRFDPLQMIYASAVVLSYEDLAFLEERALAERQTFPYIPGLLGFRESPLVIKTILSFTSKPDLIFVDGHGISHPRRFGIACQIGVLLDIPTIGVAKNILVGKPESELSSEAGSQINLIHKDQKIGTLLRTKARSNPLIISPGHKVSFETAVNLVQSCLRGYRLPEPTRFAHLAANRCRQAHRNSLSL